jgi:JmjC domain
VSRRGLRTPFLRMAKDGTLVETARYTGSGGAGAQIADQIRDDQVLELFLDGSTLVLQGLHRTWPPLIDFAGRLAAELGHPVQINAYVTPPQSRGFAAHYDVHDVFVLQVAGSKRWAIREPVHAHPLRDQPWTQHRAAVAAAAREQPPVLDTVLHPGDALYLPRGYLHAAEALGDVSAHLTVGVHPVTRYAVVEALTELAAAEPALRASLPLGVDVADPAHVAAHVQATLAALSEWLRNADPADVSAQLHRRMAASVRPEPVAPLAQAAAVSTVDKTTGIRLRAGLACALRRTGEQLVLDLGERQLSLPAACEPAVLALLAGRTVAVGELPGLGPDEQRELAQRLLRAAVVIPEWGDGRPGGG